jgi:hypothetical protein
MKSLHVKIVDFDYYIFNPNLPNLSDPQLIKQLLSIPKSKMSFIELKTLTEIMSKKQSLIDAGGTIHYTKALRKYKKFLTYVQDLNPEFTNLHIKNELVMPNIRTLKAFALFTLKDEEEKIWNEDYRESQ